MVKLFLLSGMMLVMSQVPSYVASDSGSSVKFKIKNLGVTISGSLTGLQGKVSFDAANPAGSSFDASVDVNTINTGIDMRDDHLRQQEYFDVKNFPRIKFVSTKVEPARKSGSYTMTGQLTIKGVSKQISFPFTATQQGDGYLFNGSFKINRRDFNVGGSSVTMSDNLTVELSVLASKG